MAKLSEKEKVVLLESAVLRNDVAEVRRLFAEHGGFEFTARALGLACRFCGLEMVEALVEGGVTFKYKNSEYMMNEYGIHPNRVESARSANYAAMISLGSITWRGWCGVVTTGIDPQCSFCASGIYPNGEREPIAEEERLKIVRYLLERQLLSKAECEMILFFASATVCLKIADYLMLQGVYLTDSNYDGDNFYSSLTERYGTRARLEVLNELEKMTEAQQLDAIDRFAKALSRGGGKLLVDNAMMKVLHSRPLLKCLFECESVVANCSAQKLLERAMEADDAALMAELLKRNYVKTIKAQNELIDRASRENRAQVLAALLDYKNRTADVAKEATARERREERELKMSPTSKTFLKKMWNYEKLPDGAIAIIGYKGSDVDVVVPEVIEGAPVAEIGEAAFAADAKGLTKEKIANRRQIRTVALPDGIRRVGEGAFRTCTGLAEIAIPQGAEIGASAFAGCERLASVSIPDGIEKISDSAFAGCTSLTGIALPESVEIIGDSAFAGCTGLTDIVISRSVKAIGSRAFAGCTGLTDIAIPESVEKLGWYVFEGCIGLKSIEIPSKVTKIPNGMFAGCSGLRAVEIPRTVTEIGPSAFKGCSGLGAIEIPSSVTGIGSSAFADCSGLTSIAIPEGAETIGREAFYRCTGIKAVEMPGTVAKIEEMAFAKCEALTAIEIPSSVESIEDCAFWYCTGLKQISLPEGLTEINNGLCRGCEALTDIAIPKGVRMINENAFEGCKCLANVSLSEGLLEIGKSAFANCGALTDLALPEGVLQIDEGAFANCRQLAHIRIPASVSKIEDRAFDGCDGGLEIQCVRGSYAEKYAASSAMNCRAEEAAPGQAAQLKPKGPSMAQLQKAWNFEKLPNATMKIIGYRGEDLDVVVPAEIGGFAVSTVGAYAFCPGRYGRATPETNERRAKIRTIALPDCVAEILAGAFAGCGALTSVTLPKGISEIDRSLFQGCASLAEVAIPKGVVKIGSDAFRGCTALKEIAIPEGVREIGSDAFRECIHLTSIAVPGSVTKIGRCAFDTSAIFVANRDDGRSEGPAIRGGRGSYAEEYAKQNGLKFEAID